METADIEYDTLMRDAVRLEGEQLISYWLEQLPFYCRDEYLASTLRPTEILRFRHGSFEYLLDYYTALEHRGEVPYSAWEEDRLIVAFGRSAPRKRQRDDGRLRGWVGPTHKTFGTGWDKGHYIAHSLGGAIEGVEANVFVQRRDFNRGSRYRKMEEYCAKVANTFCFSRPLYSDGSSRPTFVDFGLITAEGQLWVERFDNRSVIATAANRRLQPAPPRKKKAARLKRSC
jgi:hypothetical protein